MLSETEARLDSMGYGWVILLWGWRAAEGLREKEREGGFKEKEPGRSGCESRIEECLSCY